jgi:hypothetical protein
MRFSVSVPVLSVRMMVVAPSVSTADKRSIKAFCRAMRHMPRASASVATIGKPSGIAATASAIAASTIRKGSLPVVTPTPARSAVRINVAQISWADRRASLFSSGELPGSASSTSCDTRPSSVESPVATTTPVPLPRVRAVPLNSIDLRSPRRASAATQCVALSTATDSPVKVDSSAARLDASISLKSAEIASPASSTTMSPGTICSAAMRRTWPSRRTRAEREPSVRSASMERAALSSVRKPISALSASTTAIALPSCHSPK